MPLQQEYELCFEPPVKGYWKMEGPGVSSGVAVLTVLWYINSMIYLQWQMQYSSRGENGQLTRDMNGPEYVEKDKYIHWIRPKDKCSLVVKIQSKRKGLSKTSWQSNLNFVWMEKHSGKKLGKH